jgi:predicted nucleic acid-binding protein
MSLLGAHMAGRARLALLDFTIYEVGNALSNKGLEGDDLAGLLGSLLDYDFVWLTGTDRAHVTQAATMARSHGLSFYDASYLAAALLHDLPVVTDDAALFQAASDEGVGIDLASVGAV